MSPGLGCNLLEFDWWNQRFAGPEPAERARERPDIRHIRFPIRDFDPFDLRMKLPSAVQTLAQQMAEQPGTAYIHCTAGLGRAPGVALAYMYWVLDMPLEKAYEQLFDRRPCHPQLGSIRSATCDILAGSRSTTQVRLSIPRGTATTVEIAGLDCGWGSRCELSLDEDGDEFVLLRDMPVGKFSYKYIIDGEWTLNPDAPTRDDDGNLNNFVEVIPEDPIELERRGRLEMPGRMTPRMVTTSLCCRDL
ncbi:Phosphoglucan phosphatase DSP4, chloroplastic [Cymbomonas tetramitiformis]|uniref:Phosphoglucan phosphatase DSP4, chloroplastic n=1 Tax=Cymbomonas tetramitiformis TaxID=36881 RepID=A0AAE0LHM7_9CHLO|nr:Phosphoglucan phosphatase DSP4, chloroplastic [Cymbomonas tetramitiformis]